jgi:phage terminase large subunit
MTVGATWQFQALVDNTPGTVVMVGGTRSGKTYAGLQYWIQRLSKEKGKTLDVVRKYRESHKAAALTDFRTILESWGRWDEDHFSKSELSYKIGSSTIRFIGMDVDEKKMGAGRDFLWINEASELDQDSYRHLAMRTRGDTMMFDLNPKTDDRHWLKSDVMERKGTVTIKSTYKDNPYLTARQIEEIEIIKNQDPDFWKVYGEGEWVALVGNIYKNWTTAPYFPDIPFCYGLDFGMTDPLALVKVGVHENNLYWQEMIYQTNMTNADLILWLKANDISGMIYCDSADKNRIVELQGAGFHAVGADKSPGSLRAGIDYCRRFKIHLVKSPNGEREIMQYKWKEDRKGNISDGEPVDYMNHFLDAARYATYTRHATYIERAEQVLVRL